MNTFTLIWRILLAWLGFIACVLIFAALTGLLANWMPPPAAHVAGATGVAAAVLGLVIVLRRYVDRRPWRDMGLPVDRTALPRLLFGFVLAAAVTTAAATVTVWLGLAEWTTPALPGVAATIIGLVTSTLLVQGFPEELVFRGYVFRNLGDVVPLWAVVVVSSVIFGSMHVFSRSGATTPAEHALYAVMATGFGLALAACRTVSGTLWLGIGFHAGFDASNGVFVALHAGAFTPALLVTTGALVAAAAITFAVRRSRVATDWRGDPCLADSR